MRRSYQNRQILLDDEGNLIAICFGYAYCCEHECGLGGFYSAFGIPGPTRKQQGVLSRQIRELDPDSLKFKKLNKDTVLLWESVWYSDDLITEVPSELSVQKWPGAEEEDLKWTAAWVSGPGSPSFGLRFRNEDAHLLEQLHEAFLRKDVSLWTSGGSNPFEGSGLVLTVTSRVTEEADERVIKLDLAHLQLLEDSEATGIEKQLKKANKGWYALKPGRNNKVKNGNSDVIYFLNPHKQDLNHSGWYTVSELQQWIDGKGPIPKSTEEVEKVRKKNDLN